MSLAKSIEPDQSSEVVQMISRVFEKSSSSIFVLSSEGYQIIFSNPRSEEDTYIETENLIGLKFPTLFLEEDQPAINTVLSTTIEWGTGTDPQRRLQKKNGKKIFVEISTSHFLFEGNSYILCEVKDITSKVKAETKIKEYNEKLENLNVELEARVVEKTRELLIANNELTVQKKEMQDIMDNIQQAIFTIAPDQTVNKGHSKHAESLFGLDSIEEMDVKDLLFPSGEETKISLLKKWLDGLFKMPQIWDTVKEVAIRDVEFYKELRGEKQKVEIRVSWWPIIVSDELKKMMVICSDVTEENELKRKIEKSDRDHDLRLEMMAQIVSLPANRLNQVVKDLGRLVKVMLDISQTPEYLQSPNSVKALKGNMHSIKGLSMQFGFSGIKRASHSVEEYLLQMNKEKPSESADQIQEELTFMANAFEDLNNFYKTITSGGSDENPQTPSVSVPISKIEALIGNDHLHEMEKLLWVPLSPVFGRAKALADSLSEELGTPVTFHCSGGETEIDVRAIAFIEESLVHLIRNCFSHGTKQNNPLSVHLSGSETGGWVMIQIADDGNGIDPSKIREKLKQKRLISSLEASQLTDEQIIQFIFEDGFSTKEKADDLAGRGIGLSHLKQLVEFRLAGRVFVKSKMNDGSHFVISLPKEGYRKKEHIYPACLGETISNQISRSMNIQNAESLDRDNKNVSFCEIGKKDKIAEVNLSNIIFTGNESPSIYVPRLFQPPKGSHFINANIRGFSERVHVLTHQIEMTELGREPSFNAEAYLYPKSEIHKHVLEQSTQKEAILEEIRECVRQSGGFRNLADLVTLTADESIMNAFFDAPVDSSGKQKFYETKRSHLVELQEEDRPLVQFGYDHDKFYLSVKDPFGSLKWNKLSHRLIECYADTATPEKNNVRGSGLGIYTTLESSTYTVIVVKPGCYTEFISVYSLCKSYADYEKQGQSISFFELKTNSETASNRFRDNK